MTGRPPSWLEVDLQDVALISGGIQKQPKRKPRLNPVPFLRVANVGRGSLDLSDVHEIEVFDGELERYALQPGDLLVVEGNGSPDQIGRAARWRGDVSPCVHQNHLIRVRPTPVIAPAFLEFFWNSPQAASRVQDVASTTSGLYTLSTGKIKGLPVVLPPLAEQARIVAAIDEAFSLLDAGETSLHNTRTRLKRMRDSVLTAAVTGQLVPQDPTDTPADQELLARGVRATEDPDLPDLPGTWRWVRLGELVGKGAITDGPFGSNLKTEHYTATGPRVIRLQNIGDGMFHDDKAHISDAHFQLLTKHEVKSGDVLVASLGERLPRACIAPSWLGPAIVKADCIRIRPDHGIVGRLLVFALNSPPTRERVSRAIKGVGRPRVNLGELRNTPIPVPPTQEQTRIVAEVERLFSFIEAAERAVAAGLARSKGLRRSVLKAAFEGRLVPQDPTDEPATILLERIAAKRAAH